VRRSTVASLETNAAAVRAARLPRRPSFHALVIIPAVAVIVVMAIIVSNSAADALRESAKESAVQNVEAIVRGYLDPALGESSLDLDATRDPAIDQQLERLTQSGELRRISIWSRDGRVVYSSDPALRGRRFSIGAELGSAYAGEGVARYIDAGEGGAPAQKLEPGADPTMARRYLELFVPIRGMVDGNPIGVYDVFQDAQRIEARVDTTRLGVFILALIASSLLGGLIVLAFGGTSRVLAAQNRRLQEQATTERLLMVDLQRSEERFRSLVRNASDVVAVLGPDGVIKYQTVLVRCDVEVEAVTVADEDVKFERLELPPLEEDRDESRERQLGLIEPERREPRGGPEVSPVDDVEDGDLEGGADEEEES